MPIIQFVHDLDACSSSPSISASLRVKHIMEINGVSQQPMGSPSLSLLRAMKLGADLRIELICLLEGAFIPPVHIQTFPFMSAILTSLQEATCGATGLCRMDKHEKSDEVLRHFIVLQRDSETSVAPRLRLRSLELSISLPGRIHEFTKGLYAADPYSVLESPPLPLQLCFDDLCSQLLAHLTFYYPSLFGEYAKTLCKNTKYLDSILTSLSRIFDRSTNGDLKRQAQLHKLSLLDNVRSRLQNQVEVLDSTSREVAAEGGTNDLAQSINQDICCIWLRLDSSEKQGNLSVPVRDTDELEIHEDLPEPALEDEDSRGDPIIDTDSDGDLNVPWWYRSSCSPQSILDRDTLPTSPY
ncbi:unnamed protein product [Rhizoctonia solani]|uniref:Uncharacterized protein n=1 Tax=Rhizoctonia solani TaxID=456999 RepID=A0A8H3DKC8_9AGAM|nr:unnamed protein product [Rhizoctonia solani]CAE6525045.1 unnamed protein product [Rhizoctonia solani]